MANFLAVDVRQHNVQDDNVRTVLLDHQPGVEAVRGDAHLETAVLFEELVHQLDQFGVVVYQKHFALAAFQCIGRDAIVPHEFVEGFARDAPETGSGHAEPLQLAVVETTDDGLLTDFANFGGFAGRENSFHASFIPYWHTASRTSVASNGFPSAVRDRDHP